MKPQDTFRAVLMCKVATAVDEAAAGDDVHLKRRRLVVRLLPALLGALYGGAVGGAAGHTRGHAGMGALAGAGAGGLAGYGLGAGFSNLNEWLGADPMLPTVKNAR